MFICDKLDWEKNENMFATEVVSTHVTKCTLTLLNSPNSQTQKPSKLPGRERLGFLAQITIYVCKIVFSPWEDGLLFPTSLNAADDPVNCSPVVSKTHRQATGQIANQEPSPRSEHSR